MSSPRPNRAIAIALWANALLLGGILLTLSNRGGGLPSVLPAAFGAQGPIAGGAGVFVMPAQTSVNTWGAYLLDVDSQSLCVYQFYPGEKQLRLVAARDYKFDRKLRNFNSPNPSPAEVKALVDREAAAQNVGAGTTPAPESGRQDPKLKNE